MAIVIPSVFGELLTKIITAILILLLGFVAGRLLGSIINKVMLAVFAKKGTNKRKNATFARNLSGIISLCIYIIAVIFAFKTLGIITVIWKSVLIIILVIIAGAALFGIIDFLLNAYFGMKIITSSKFEKGDTIKIKKVEGTVEKIGLGRTKLRTKTGDVFIISNRSFFKNKFTREKKKV